MNPPSKASFFDGLYHVHDDATESTDDEEADPGVVSFSPRRPSAAKEAVPNPPTTRPVLKRPPESLRFSLDKIKKTGKIKSRTAAGPTSDIFNGFCFYYFPNNLKGVARKFRIELYGRHGAFCINAWGPEFVTHVIVDSSSKYESLLQELKLDTLPEHIIVVNDLYPGDCLSNHRLVDPNISLYTVPRKEPLVPADLPPALAVPQLPLSEELQIKTAPDAVDETRHTNKTTRDIGSSSSSDSGDKKHKDNSSSRPKDDLDQVISDATRMPYLDDDDSKTDDKNVEDSEDEERGSPVPKKRKTTKKGTNAGFQCMKKSPGSSSEPNPNQRTIQVLSEMKEYYERINDTWHSISYRKAITTLRGVNRRICFASEAIELPNIGERIAAKIEEVVRTDQLQRLEYAKLEPNETTIQLFLGVYGAGSKHARAWVAKGHRSLEDLLEKEVLSASQRIGVQRHADFAKRIPRDEVRKHGEFVIETAKEIDGDLILQVMGSYRRGAKDCGDIDIMITKQDAESREMRKALDNLIGKLSTIGFLKCGLAIPRGHDDGSKWHGASQLSPELPWRRIDFLIVPWAERGAALIYFTGNDIFNRSMRLLASKKGYRLNQRGLYKNIMRGPQRQRITDGELLEGESEEKIFEILGVPYRPPEDRNC